MCGWGSLFLYVRRRAIAPNPRVRTITSPRLWTLSSPRVGTISSRRVSTQEMVALCLLGGDGARREIDDALEKESHATSHLIIAYVSHC